jgi:hypothetical protein
MKIFRIIFTLAFVLFFFPAQTQEKNGKEKFDSLKAAYPQQIRTVLKTNPGAIFWGAIPLLTSEYRIVGEFVNGTNQSSQFGISFMGKSPYVKLMERDTLINPRMEKLLIEGYRLQASYRFFFNKILYELGFTDELLYAPMGIYLSPHLSYATAKITNKFSNQFDRYFRVVHANFSFVGGFQFFLFDFLSFDAFAGLGYKQNLWFEKERNGIVRQIPSPEGFKDLPLYDSPLKINLGFNLGYGF